MIYFVAGLEAVVVAVFLGVVCSVLYSFVAVVMLVASLRVMLVASVHVAVVDFLIVFYFLGLCYWCCAWFRFNCFLLY